MKHVVFFDSVGAWIGANFIDWLCFVVAVDCFVMITVSYAFDLVMSFMVIAACTAVVVAALFHSVFTDATDVIIVVGCDGTGADLCDFDAVDWSAACIVIFVASVSAAFEVVGLFMICMLPCVIVECACAVFDTADNWVDDAFRFCVEVIGNFTVVGA